METTDMLERNEEFTTVSLSEAAGGMAMGSSTLVEAVPDTEPDIKPLSLEEAERRHRLAIDYGHGRISRDMPEYDELVELSRRAG